MSDPATKAIPQHGAVSPAPQNVGEGFKKAAYEMTEKERPTGSFAGFRFFMERFGDMMSRVVLTVLYVVLIAPIGVIYRFVTDPLMTRYPKTHSSFVNWHSENDRVEKARQQG